MNNKVSPLSTKHHRYCWCAVSGSAVYFFDESFCVAEGQFSVCMGRPWNGGVVSMVMGSIPDGSQWRVLI